MGSEIKLMALLRNAFKIAGAGAAIVGAVVLVDKQAPVWGETVRTHSQR